MKKNIGLGTESPEEIKEILNANADSVEETQYFRRMTHQELLDAKEKHTAACIDIANLEEQKKVAMTQFKSELDPLKDEAKGLLSKLQHKGEIVKGKVFKMIDWEEGMVGLYSESGELVSSRPMMESERQTNIIGSIRPTGTGDSPI